MGNFKNRDSENVQAKKDFDSEEDIIEKNEDYLMVDKEDTYFEPADPKKEDLKSAEFLNNDDDDDDLDEF